MATSSPTVNMEIRLATEKFLSELKNLESRYDATMKAVAADSSGTATALDQSFRVLGIKGVQAVEAEVKKLQAALAAIRANPDVFPADKAAAVAAFNSRLAELRGTAQQTPPALNGVAASSTSAGTSMLAAAKGAALWAAALVGIGSATAVGKQLIDTGSQFENLRVRLDNLLGGTEKAEQAFTMIKRLAAETPFEVAGLTESFVKLTAFGMQPSEAQMRSLSDVAANLGGGTEILSRVTLALGQAWTKSKLQGQEIMQLAEAGVPVWDALAHATGRSVPELNRMSEAGLLGRDVISKLIDELGRMNEGASVKLMNTYAGSISNVKDAMAEFFDLVSRSGVLDYLTGKVKELLAEFDRMKQSGELEAKAKAIANTFIEVAGAVDSTIKALVRFAPQIKLVVEAAIALKAANMAGAFVSLAAGATQAAVGMGAVATQSVATTATLSGAAVAVGRVATALRVLRSLSGIGLVLGVAELAQEFFRAKKAAEDGDKAVAEMLRPRPVNGPKDAAKAAADEITKTGQKAQDITAEFNKLIEDGKSVDDALNDIGKKFDLSTVPGIQDAGAVLDGLVTSGKITATQFRREWDASLKDVNLGEFEVRARQAFDGSAQGARILTQAIDAGLREAVRRSGGDFEVISGGMGKAAKSAVGDVDYMIDNLARLKASGADVGQALTLSLGKAINTADSQAAIDAVRTRIEAVRKVLGDKIADGLLDQAKQKALDLKDALDKATPGVNSLREAMKTLGVTSDESLKQTAKTAQEAYEVMRVSGTSSARELTAAFQKAATEAIAANNGIAPSWVTAQAAARGFEVQVDSAGKAILRAMGGGSAAVQSFGRDVQATTEYLKAQAAALDAMNAKYAKPKGGSVTGSSREERLAGQAATDGTGAFALREKQRAGLLSADDLKTAEAVLSAAKFNKQMFDENSKAYSLEGTRSIFEELNSATIILAQVKALADRADVAAPAAPTPGTSTPTHAVTINIDGNSRGTINTDAAGEATLQNVLQQLAAARGTAAR
jgi:tape measure domain-containing protein